MRLKQWALPEKKKTFVAAEADEEERAAFRAEGELWPKERFVFIDETGINTDMARRHGRSLRGKRIQEKLPRNTPKPLAVIGALSLGGLRATMELEGSVNKAAFLLYLREWLAPELEWGDIVFLDRLGAHRGSEIKEAVEERGARLVYLPAYSPDFNPIEQCWSKLKEAMRSAAARSPGMLRRALVRTLRTITAQDAKGWFAHAGYPP